MIPEKNFTKNRWPSCVTGLTGSIAAGKSEAALTLMDSGIPVLCADRWARRAVEPGSTALDMLYDRYGEEILDGQGKLDRPVLRRLMLESGEEKKYIESVVHPEVFRLMDMELCMMAEAGMDMVVVEVPLLYETGMEELFDTVVVITAPLEQRIVRLCRRNSIDRQEALRWIGLQMPQHVKAAMADTVICNSGSLSGFRVKVRELAEEIRNFCTNGDMETGNR